MKYKIITKFVKWFRKRILGIEYFVGVDLGKGKDYSSRVTCKRNLITGTITIIKIEYF